VGYCYLQEVGHRLEVVVQSRNWNRRSRSQACPQTRQIRLLLLRLLGLVLDLPSEVLSMQEKDGEG